MKKVAVVTASRAEYGALKNIIMEISKDSDLELMLWVTGSHLSVKHGMTIDEIINDGYPIAARIPIISESNGEKGITETIANAAKGFGELMLDNRPDMLLVIGDRYELLPICTQAVVLDIPITHISGGEITEGAIDDVVRHSVSKMSTLHFPACEQYRRRIIQMGEEPERVFNYGDVGVENIRKIELMSKDELEESLGVKGLNKYAVVTYHPVTRERGRAEIQVTELCEAMKMLPEMDFIITGANADFEGDVINNILKRYVANNSNMYFYSSLGIKRYLSAVKYCEFVLGNSSSGIIEAPTMRVPTVNIGNRQQGRLKADGIIDCDTNRKDIYEAMKKACTKEHMEKALSAVNPYGDGETSKMIVEEIKIYFEHNEFSSKKFFDLGEECIEKYSSNTGKGRV